MEATEGGGDGPRETPRPSEPAAERGDAPGGTAEEPAKAKPKDDRDRRAESHPEETAKYEELRQKFLFEKLALVRSKDLEGVGGVLKQAPAYFNVTEIPFGEDENAAAPEAKRNHVWITLRRSGMNTKDVAFRLEKVLGVRRNSVGYAGLKDRYATCTQTFSIDDSPDRSLEKIRELLEADTSTPRVQLVGEVRRASRKLRRGHLRGNRFRILITDLAVSADEALARAHRIAEDLAARGVANYFGDQRVGNNASTALAGYRELSIAREYIDSLSDAESDGEVASIGNGAQATTTTQDQAAAAKTDPEPVPTSPSATETVTADKNKTPDESEEDPVAYKNARPGSKKRKATRPGFFRFCRKVKKIRKRGTFQSDFSMNAFQSAVFNSILSERIKLDMFSQEVVGDVVMNQTGGAARLVDDEATLPTSKDRAEGITFALPLVGDRGGSFAKGKAQEVESRMTRYVCDLPWEAFWLSHQRSTLRPARLSMDQLEFQVEKVPSVHAYLDDELQRTGSTAHEAGPSQAAPSAAPSSAAGPPAPATSQSPGISETSNDGEGLLFTFCLPKGSYATSVLREFITLSQPAAAEDAEGKVSAE